MIYYVPAIRTNLSKLGVKQLDHGKKYFNQVITVAQNVDLHLFEEMAMELVALRERKGRLFILGVGGSAGNASHAVNDFRKLCGIESYAPTDNASELTARTNDEGFETIFESFLKVSRANEKDGVLVFSVGGGNAERQVSVNIIRGLEEARKRRMKILGIVGRDGGFTKQVGDCVMVIPSVDEDFVTPHTESFQTVIWHGLVSHPAVQINATKW